MQTQNTPSNIVTISAAGYSDMPTDLAWTQQQQQQQQQQTTASSSSSRSSIRRR
jgi:hypothetical protein